MEGKKGKKRKMGYVETLKCRTKQLTKDENTKVLKQPEKNELFKMSFPKVKLLRSLLNLFVFLNSMLSSHNAAVTCEVIWSEEKASLPVI